MGQRELHLMPANGQPVLPFRALFLASQQRPLLRAVPITCPHLDQQYSHRLITDRRVQMQDELKGKTRDISNGYRIIFFSISLYTIVLMR